jgi:hypothetical protein
MEDLGTGQRIILKVMMHKCGVKDTDWKQVTLQSCALEMKTS